MDEKQLELDIIKLFGEDRKPFISYLKKAANREDATRNMRRMMKSFKRPFKLESLLKDSAWTAIEKRKFNKLDTLYIGRPAWKATLLLNNGVGKGYDWKRKLSKKCGGTARLLTIWFNEALTLFAMDSIYVQYSQRKNCYEIGPLDNFSPDDEKLVRQIATELTNAGWQFIKQGIAERMAKGFRSPLNPDGNARLFNVVFGDDENYQNGFHRFSDKNTTDTAGRLSSWHEYYTIDGILILRKEYSYYGSDSILITSTDSMDRIKRVEVHRELADETLQTFGMDIPNMKRDHLED